MAWSERVSNEVAARRAGGRRRYQALRQEQATLRRTRVVQLMTVYGLQRGARARIARELRVSQSTISRDIAGLLFTQPKPSRDS